jgi:hypothetical protein
VRLPGATTFLILLPFLLFNMDKVELRSRGSEVLASQNSNKIAMKAFLTQSVELIAHKGYLAPVLLLWG